MTLKKNDVQSTDQSGGPEFQSNQRVFHVVCRPKNRQEARTHKTFG